jgi:hypothetical protein
MKIQEKWLVEGVRVEGGGKLLVEFDSRPEGQEKGKELSSSKITGTCDGDDSVVMSMSDGKAFAEKFGERVNVVLEIDDGRPQEEPRHQRNAREALEMIESRHTAGKLIDSEDIAAFRKLLR